jgi:hypothetical protein
MTPARLARNQKIVRFIEKKLAALEGKEHTRSKLRVVLNDCGWRKRSPENLDWIQSACEEAAIYPEPMVTAPGLDWEEMIYFSRRKPDPYFPDWYAPQHAFSSEKALQRFLVENFTLIPQFKKLKDPKAEFELPSRRRIDILCREKKTNAFVVIELKKRDVDPLDQLRRYLAEVDRRLAQRGPKRYRVKGMIVTGEPNAALERSLRERIPDYPVVWFLYRAQVTLYERAESP